MNKLLEAAGEICTFMAERKWKFCIIGGLAVLHRRRSGGHESIRGTHARRYRP